MGFEVFEGPADGHRCISMARSVAGRRDKRRRAMELSTDRILTTHVGSLPRPPQMLEVLAASGSFEQGKASANPDYERRTREAVAQQLAALAVELHRIGVGAG
jgi:hypothetical protein